MVEGTSLDLLFVFVCLAVSSFGDHFKFSRACRASVLSCVCLELFKVEVVSSS